MFEIVSAIEIGKRLRQLRGQRSLEEVAKATGISTSAIGMYEIGQRIPKDENKVKLVQYYQVPVEKLFFSSDYHVK